MATSKLQIPKLAAIKKEKKKKKTDPHPSSWQNYPEHLSRLFGLVSKPALS